MVIKPGEPDSPDDFKFKIGDKAGSRLGATNRMVISGSCADFGVFYVIKFKPPTVMTGIGVQDKIELGSEP
jgi:hypothetical protein